MYSIEHYKNTKFTCISDYHDGMPRVLGFMELYYLGNNNRNLLQVIIRKLSLYGSLQVPVVQDGRLDSGEQILYDSVEKRRVVCEGVTVKS